MEELWCGLGLDWPLCKAIAELAYLVGLIVCLTVLVRLGLLPRWAALAILLWVLCLALIQLCLRDICTIESGLEQSLLCWLLWLGG